MFSTHEAYVLSNILFVSVDAFNLDKAKFFSSGKGLTLYSIDTHFDASTTDNSLKTL